MPNDLKCRAKRKSDGTPCRAPSKLVDSETGYCPSHDPDPERREALLEAARKGGRETAKRLRPDGLSADVLGPLEDVEDARRWCMLIGQAVLDGRVGHREATAAVRALEAAAKLMQTATREEIADLRAAIKRAKNVKAVR